MEHPQLFMASLLTLGAAASLDMALTAQVATRPSANDSSVSALVLPSDAERAFQELPWHSSFSQAALVAHRERKPVLLWTMNGHPLGCT